MKRAKLIVKLVVFAAVAAVLLVLGCGEKLTQSKAISLGWMDIGRILLVIFAVLAG